MLNSMYISMSMLKIGCSGKSWQPIDLAKRHDNILSSKEIALNNLGPVINILWMHCTSLLCWNMWSVFFFHYIDKRSVYKCSVSFSALLDLESIYWLFWDFYMVLIYIPKLWATIKRVESHQRKINQFKLIISEFFKENPLKLNWIFLLKKKRRRNKKTDNQLFNNQLKFKFLFTSTKFICTFCN